MYLFTAMMQYNINQEVREGMKLSNSKSIGKLNKLLGRIKL